MKRAILLGLELDGYRLVATNLGWRPSRIASRAESGVKRTITVQLFCGVQEPRRTFSSSGTEPSHNSRLFLIAACSWISVLDPGNLGNAARKCRQEGPSTMHRELDPQEYETWDRVVANAVPCHHIVQLYQEQNFLNRAVCRFAHAGFAKGEGVILVSTLPHWNSIGARLE